MLFPEFSISPSGSYLLIVCHQVPHFDLLPLFSIGVSVLESNIRLERFKEFFRNDRISYQPWLLSSIENLPVLEFYHIFA